MRCSHLPHWEAAAEETPSQAPVSPTWARQERPPNDCWPPLPLEDLPWSSSRRCPGLQVAFTPLAASRCLLPGNAPPLLSLGTPGSALGVVTLPKVQGRPTQVLGGLSMHYRLLPALHLVLGDSSHGPAVVVSHCPQEHKSHGLLTPSSTRRRDREHRVVAQSHTPTA